MKKLIVLLGLIAPLSLFAVNPSWQETTNIVKSLLNGEILLQKSSGLKTNFMPTANTDFARGELLLRMTNYLSAGDVLQIGPGKFNFGPNAFVNTVPNVALLGSGVDVTFIVGTNINVDEVVSCALNVAKTNTISDMTIFARNGIHSVSSAQGIRVKNVKIRTTAIDTGLPSNTAFDLLVLNGSDVDIEDFDGRTDWDGVWVTGQRINLKNFNVTATGLVNPGVALILGTGPVRAQNFNLFSTYSGANTTDNVIGIIADNLSASRGLFLQSGFIFTTNHTTPANVENMLLGDGNVTVLPDVVYDDSKVTLSGAGVLIHTNAHVQFEPYGVSWDGSARVPSQNDIYDKIETIVGGSGIPTLNGTGTNTTIKGLIAKSADGATTVLNTSDGAVELPALPAPVNTGEINRSLLVLNDLNQATSTATYPQLPGVVFVIDSGVVDMTAVADTSLLIVPANGNYKFICTGWTAYTVALEDITDAPSYKLMVDGVGDITTETSVYDSVGQYVTCFSTFNGAKVASAGEEVKLSVTDAAGGMGTPVLQMRFYVTGFYAPMPP